MILSMKTIVLYTAILSITFSFTQDHESNSYAALKSDLKKMDNKIKCPPENVLIFDNKINNKGHLTSQKVKMISGKTFCTYKFKYKNGEIESKSLSYSKALDRYLKGKFYYKDGKVSMLEYKDSKLNGNDLKVFTKTIMYKKDGGSQWTSKTRTYEGSDNVYVPNYNNAYYGNQMTTYPVSNVNCNNRRLGNLHRMTHPNFKLTYFNERFDYDLNNRINSRDFYDKYHRKKGSIEYDYDLHGRLEEIKYYINYRKVGSIDIDYNLNGQVESVIYRDGFGRRL